MIRKYQILVLSFLTTAFTFFLIPLFSNEKVQAAINPSSCPVGVSCWSTRNFIQYIPGDLPIIFDIPHSGRLIPTDIHDRTQGSILSGLDSNSREYALRATSEIERITGGKKPHIIINHLHRSKYDANRNLQEACYPHITTFDPNNPCHMAWNDFHVAIDDAATRVRNAFGEGHVFDIHTWGGAIGIYLGTNLTLSDLNRSDSALNTTTYENKSTQRHLAITHSNTLSEVTRGARSIAGFLAALAYPAFPSPQFPTFLPNGGTFPDGAFNVERHGSARGGVIDSTQIETHFSFINATASIDSYGKDLGLAIHNFVKEKYQFADFNPNYTPTPSITIGPSPSPTPTGTQGTARMKFKILLPDISQAVSSISSSDVQIELRDGTTVIGLSNVSLTRNANYFQTSQDVAFNIVQSKAYSIFIKTKISIGRLFNNVTLIQSQTLDCTQIVNLSCGELITQRDNRPLISGDSDGFQTSSGSYNKIDSADLQLLASLFNTQQPTTGQSADFNLDGQVNISDLEILGKNYGLKGD